MNDIDTSIAHITLENGNVFEDLGFSPQEATKLKIKAHGSPIQTASSSDCPAMP